MFRNEDVRFPAEGSLTASNLWPKPSEAGFVVRLHDQRRRRETMTNVTYDKQLTALLVIDPYNDFMSDGGKVWDRLKAVAEANRCVPHMVQVLQAVRQAGRRVCYALHHRYRPGDDETWTYIAPTQKAAWSHQTFEHGTWGGEIRREFAPQPGDIVALEHWVFQWLCQHRSGCAAQAARPPSAHRHRTPGPHVRGVHRPLCRGAGLRGHDGERRDRE